ncbi:16016_t:CDS:2, partial [Racocetra fulgida]
MSDCYTTSDEFDLCDATSEEESDSLNDVKGEAIATVMSSQQKELSDIIARICGKCGQKFSPTTTTGVLSNHLIQKPYGKGDARRKKEYDINDIDVNSWYSSVSESYFNTNETSENNFASTSAETSSNTTSYSDYGDDDFFAEVFNLGGSNNDIIEFEEDE